MNEKSVTILRDGEESQQSEREVKEDRASMLNCLPKLMIIMTAHVIPPHTSSYLQHMHACPAQCTHANQLYSFSTRLCQNTHNNSIGLNTVFNQPNHQVIGNLVIFISNWSYRTIITKVDKCLHYIYIFTLFSSNIYIYNDPLLYVCFTYMHV